LRILLFLRRDWRTPGKTARDELQTAIIPAQASLEPKAWYRAMNRRPGMPLGVVLDSCAGFPYLFHIDRSQNIL